MDVWAAAFVGLPGRCTVSAQVKHGVGDWTNAVERIDPSFFVEESDAVPARWHLWGSVSDC